MALPLSRRDSVKVYLLTCPILFLPFISLLVYGGIPFRQYLATGGNAWFICCGFALIFLSLIVMIDPAIKLARKNRVPVYMIVSFLGMALVIGAVMAGV